MTEVGDEFFDFPNLEVNKWFRGGVVAVILVDDWIFECWAKGW